MRHSVWLGASGIFLCSFFLTCVVHAQVATAPFGPDQRLVNPAVLPYRVLRGYSISWDHFTEVAKDSNSNSSGQIDTNIDTVGVNFGWSPAPYYFETNLLPQYGTEKLNSSSTFSVAGTQQNSFSSSRSITLIPVQGILAARLGKFGTIGAKMLYSDSSFDTDEKQFFSYSNEGITVNGVSSRIGTRSTRFIVGSLGGVLNLFDTGFYLGGSLEFFNMIDDNNVKLLQTVTNSDGTSSEVTGEGGKRDIEIQKKVIGLGYLVKFSGGNSWRIDLSQETMPPLQARDSFGNEYKEGKLVRLVTEANWLYFHAGIQVTSTTGYYVDPYNVIPYLLGTQNLTGDSVVEYGIFGGLKGSKGHSFGISFSQSNQMKEKYWQNTRGAPLDTSTTTYGLSYMYAF